MQDLFAMMFRKEERMSSYTLEATIREKTGQGESRRLRRQGRLPGVLYGGDKPNIAMSFDRLEVAKLIEDAGFHTSMVDLKIQGTRGKNSALVKEIQWDPVTDLPVHLDFHRVLSSDTVHVEVPVQIVNDEKCPGTVQGGFIDLIRRSLEVVCRADLIPDSVTIDCADMDIGDVVHVEDIPLPEGIEIIHDVNFTVLTVLAPTVSETVTAEEAIEEEPGASTGD